MKKTFKALAAIFAATLLFACGKTQQPKALTWPLEASCEMTVEYNGESYPTPDVRLELAKNADGTVSITMYQVKFVPQMPVTLDITVPGVSYSGNSAVGTFSGDGIIPTMKMAGKDEPVDRYKVSDLTGTVDSENGTLTLSLLFASYRTRFQGSLK